MAGNAEAAEEGEPAPPRPPPRGPSAAALFARQHSLDETRAELWLARLAVPITLAACWVVVQTDLGRFFFRTFSGMWLHELGHALAAWMCGFPALPGPWITSVGDERSPLFAVALFGGLAGAVWRGRTRHDRFLTAAAALALSLQVFGTVVLSERSARTLITFAGDGGSLVLGAACMATFYAPRGHKLHRDWLRWGLLVLGATAFVDTFEEWWRARTDVDAIVFGEIEHVGATDASKLVDEDGWTIREMTRRYFSLGVACLLALVPLQVFRVRRTRAFLEELAREPPSDRA